MRKRSACLLLLFAGCGGVGWGSGKWFAQPENEPTVRRRAAFDPDCAAEQLSLVPLAPPDYPYQQVGVIGCGKRVTYVHTWDGWVMNADTCEPADHPRPFSSGP